MGRTRKDVPKRAAKYFRAIYVLTSERGGSYSVEAMVLAPSKKAAERIARQAEHSTDCGVHCFARHRNHVFSFGDGSTRASFQYVRQIPTADAKTILKHDVVALLEDLDILNPHQQLAEAQDDA